MNRLIVWEGYLKSIYNKLIVKLRACRLKGMNDKEWRGLALCALAIVTIAYLSTKGVQSEIH